jgi:predicted transcriptional regulator
MEQATVPYAVPYSADMRKTSVYLSDELAERLARLARETGDSQAEVLRAAIAAYRPLPSVDRTFALAGCVTGSGGSVADVDEDELLRGFGA